LKKKYSKKKSHKMERERPRCTTAPSSRSKKKGGDERGEAGGMRGGGVSEPDERVAVRGVKG